MQQLRSLVREKVAARRIVPTELDSFEIADRVFGPSIYTVVEQLIKPITLRAGKPSWALMLHPDGLPCHVFVTHCWQEGLYEFIDKVLHSWPRGAKHAYCCMLSNPQNLDITSLIARPEDSPFAKALQACTYMLVVPNHQASIYSRVWCVYEAYLGYSEAKLIFTDTQPLAGLYAHLACSLFIIVLAAGVSAAVAAQAELGSPELRQWTGDVNSNLVNPSRYTSSAVVLTQLLASLMPPNMSRLVLVWTAAACGGSFFRWEAITAVRMHKDGWAGDGAAGKIVTSLFGAAICGAVLVGTVEQLQRRQDAREKRQLRYGYSGKVREAECSAPEDKIHILEALRGRESDVETAIRVLLDNGMSTPSLRAAATRAGKITHAGHVNWSMLLFSWSVLLAPPMVHLSREIEISLEQPGGTPCNCERLNPLLVWIHCLEFVQMVAWGCMYWCLRKDMRGFAARVLIRFTFVSALLLNFALGDLLGVVIVPGHILYCLGVVPLTFAMTLAGPGRVARVPALGPFVVKVLMSNPTRPARGLCRRRPDLAWWHRAEPAA